jgi:Arc/MetJ-type ribon-helix-helix transcriptional regulator
MSITLNPEQEALVREVVASGAVTSEDDALTIALTFLRDRVIDDLEERLGLTRAELDARLQAGRAGPADPWMGADAFCTAMRDHGRLA